MSKKNESICPYKVVHTNVCNRVINKTGNNPCPSMGKWIKIL
jgi:hypothetical protein